MTLVRWRPIPGLVVTGAVVPVRIRKASVCAVCGARLAPGALVARPAASRHDKERFCSPCVSTEETEAAVARAEQATEDGQARWSETGTTRKP